MASSNSKSPTSNSKDLKSQSAELDVPFWNGVERKDWQYHGDRSAGFVPSSANVTREEMSIYTRHRIREREAAENVVAGRDSANRNAAQASASRRRGSQPLRPSPLSKLSTQDSAEGSHDNTLLKSDGRRSSESDSPMVSPLAPNDEGPASIPSSPQVSPLSSDDEDKAKDVPSPIRRRPAMRRRSIRDAYAEQEPPVQREVPQINVELTESPESDNNRPASGYFAGADRYGRSNSPGLAAAPSRGSPSSQVFDMSPLGNELNPNRGSSRRSRRPKSPRDSPPPSPSRGSPSSQMFDMSPPGGELDSKRDSSRHRR